MAIAGPGRYERATPVFDRATRTFHPIQSVGAVRPGERHVELDLLTHDGLTLTGRLTFPDPHVVRFQWAFGTVPGPHTTEMLDGDAPALTVNIDVDVDDHRIRVDAGGPSVTLYKRPWKLEFGAFATENSDTSIVEWVAEPGGYAVEEEGKRILAYETFTLSPGEELYGLGERFHGPGLRGKRLAHWLDEAFGTNTADRVYKSVPFLVSSHGYGLFFNHPEEGTFDLGAGSNASASVLVQTDQLGMFVLLGTPKEVLARYTALTGRPKTPPEWSFGIWMSRCMYASRTQVEEIVATAQANGIPVDVISIDPLWLKHRPGMNYDTCDFAWNEKDFGPLEEFVEWLHSRDIRLCLWVNTHVDEASAAWKPDRMVGEGRSREPMFPTRGYVDLTGGGADWWLEEMTRLVDAGVDAFKIDYSDTLPSDALMADGRRGAEVHNVYPLLAAQVADKAGVAVHFTRAGTSGSQRYPLHWVGDSQSTWAGLRGALRGGLALAWSGFAHWTSDIGGFFFRDLHQGDDETYGFRQPDVDLYIRWTQFGMLSSHTRFHGNGPREPWEFGDEAVAVARTFAELRASWRPYLVRCAEESTATGCPVMRPMAMEFPDDPGARHVDTQYMLGPALLVCPVLSPGGSVEAYFPPGRWTDHFTGEVVEGPAWRLFDDVPLERLPLFVREGYADELAR